MRKASNEERGDYEIPFGGLLLKEIKSLTAASQQRSFVFLQVLRRAWAHAKNKIPFPIASGRDLISFAEEEGFEPPVPVTQDNGFQDRRIRPLCHSSKSGSKV